MNPAMAWLLHDGPVLIAAAVATHLVVSFFQTLLHYRLGHRRLGGLFYRNHINFHHANYAKDHLVSKAYVNEEGNNTPYFLIPVILVGICAYFVMPLSFWLTCSAAAAASFYAHVVFDREYHVEGSWLLRFAWFRHMRELHFVHHRHAGCNFAVIDFFWDRLLGTYRPAGRDRSGAPGDRTRHDAGSGPAARASR